MLLEKTLAAYGDSSYRSEHYLKDSDGGNMGLLDTSSRSSGTTSRLITAMLADRPYQNGNGVAALSAYSSNTFSGNHNAISNTSINNSSSGHSASLYKMTMEGPNLQYKNRLYNVANGSSITVADSSSGSPPEPIAPSSVSVSMSNSDAYNSYDEESMGPGYIPSRKQREFIPENKKDDGYWEKRRKNNEAARRSREKRRIHDMALETRIMDLTRDNCKLRNELGLIKKKFGIPLEETFGSDSSNDQLSHSAGSLSNGSPPSIPTSHTQQSAVHHEFHPRSYTNTMQRPSPPSSRNRSMSVSGPIQSPYLPSYQQSPPATQPQCYPIQHTESYYISREQPATELKSYAGKYEAQSPFHLKSTKDDNPYHQQSRIEEPPRMSNCTSMGPGQMSQYGTTLPLSLQKSYWIPTTELTSSDSNDESECYDRIQDEPLSLVKKRPSTENESSGEHSNGSSRASSSPNSSSVLPLKLRHKVSLDGPTPESPTTNTVPMYSNGLAQLSDIALAQSNKFFDEYSSESFKSRPRSFTNPRTLFDFKYAERRKRNNEAARKCRENRKNVTRIREVKSDYLQTENGKLKDELVGLQEEMRELRDLLEKKRQSRNDHRNIETENDTNAADNPTEFDTAEQLNERVQGDSAEQQNGGDSYENMDEESNDAN